MSTVPLKFPRLISLFLLISFGIVGMSLGINALAKSNDQKDFLKTHAPQGATVNIDTSDVMSVGTIVTVVCGLLALVSVIIFVPLLLLPQGASTRALSTRTLPLQTAVLAFLTVFLFAALVPFTDFVATREAEVTAFLGTVQLPQSIIQAAQRQLGVTGVYKDIDYLRNATILPWVTLLFGITSTVLAFMALRVARRTVPRTGLAHRGAHQSGSGMVVEDKHTLDMKEKESQKSGSDV
ncbi:hypothetical protein NLI96_g3597 [Meripilus lineatus]|uniref:Transmembrane protein n=1 Tax=Meripilus lineatus TaxID=2056292 RepID=A0AAD5V6H1_9APHY|nr:hypothetical protein NLI96_g3597 [Physisporinus lineatus]